MTNLPSEDRPFWDLLPELYRQDAVLSDLLAVMERFYCSIERQIDQMPDQLYPVAGIPELQLEHVGRLVGLQNDDHRFTPQMLRELLPLAFELHRWKGTRRALRCVLRIYLRCLCGRPVEPSIVEFEDHCDTGAQGQALFGGPHMVTVVVPMESAFQQAEERRRLECLVREYSPAAVETQVLYHAPLGSGWLGVNTWTK